jgi:hypothetical protein
VNRTSIGSTVLPSHERILLSPSGDGLNIAAKLVKAQPRSLSRWAGPFFTHRLILGDELGAPVGGDVGGLVKN